MTPWILLVALFGLLLIFVPVTFRTVGKKRRADDRASTLVWLLRNLTFDVRVGQPLPMAIASLDSVRVSSVGYLARMQAALNERQSLQAASRSLRQANLSPAECLLEGVFSMPTSSPGALLSGLESLGRYFALVSRQVRQEKARTSQSRMQFFLVASLIPVLFGFNVVLVPDLVAHSLADPLGQALYLLAALFYVVAISLFFKLQGRSFSFLFESTEALPPDRPDSQIRESSILSVKRDYLARMRSLIPRTGSSLTVSEQTSRLGFLCALEMCARGGMTGRSALEYALRAFTQCDLGGMTQDVLASESSGAALREAFDDILSKGKREHARDEESQEIMKLIGRSIKERQQFLEATGLLVKEARERLTDLAEEKAGRVASELLLPLCLGLLPAAMLMLLSPVLCLIVGALA